MSEDEVDRLLYTYGYRPEPVQQSEWGPLSDALEEEGRHKEASILRSPWRWVYVYIGQGLRPRVMRSYSIRGGISLKLAMYLLGSETEGSGQQRTRRISDCCYDPVTGDPPTTAQHAYIMYRGSDGKCYKFSRRFI